MKDEVGTRVKGRKEKGRKQRRVKSHCNESRLQYKFTVGTFFEYSCTQEKYVTSVKGKVGRKTYSSPKRKEKKDEEGIEGRRGDAY